MSDSYAFLVDDGTQWFIALCQLDKDNQVLHQLSVHPDLDRQNPFITNIYLRRHNLFNIKINTHVNGCSSGTYYGWSISKNEYNRIVRMIELQPYAREFDELKEWA